MREIKFRAWHSQSQGMVHWLELQSIAERAICHPLHGGHPHYELMQYTGLKDKNGKEIYEGDIIDVSMIFEGSTLPHIGKIVFDESFGAFATENEGGITLLHHHALHTAKIIGNIHENPELIKD